ncbi:Hypothetical predicted protein, partial [Paramuricea clavata]
APAAEEEIAEDEPAAENELVENDEETENDEDEQEDEEKRARNIVTEKLCTRNFTEKSIDTTVPNTVGAKVVVISVATMVITAASINVRDTRTQNVATIKMTTFALEGLYEET